MARTELSTLIYKRTHPGDPNSRGHFGNEDCMGRVRAYSFDAIIGVGGIGAESSSHALDGKVNWIGIGPRRHDRPRGRGPIVTFDHFILLESQGPPLASLAPTLARRLFENNVRILRDKISPREQREIRELLKLAATAPPSKPLTQRLIGAYANGHRAGCSCHGCSSRRARRVGRAGC